MREIHEEIQDGFEVTDVINIGLIGVIVVLKGVHADEEVGWRHLLVVADDDDLVGAINRTNGIPRINLGGFIKDDEIEPIIRFKEGRYG